jgi:hypothetical protein
MTKIIIIQICLRKIPAISLGVIAIWPGPELIGGRGPRGGIIDGRPADDVFVLGVLFVGLSISSLP